MGKRAIMDVLHDEDIRWTKESNDEYIHITGGLFESSYPMFIFDDNNIMCTGTDWLKTSYLDSFNACITCTKLAYASNHTEHLVDDDCNDENSDDDDYYYYAQYDDPTLISIGCPHSMHNVLTGHLQPCIMRDQAYMYDERYTYPVAWRLSAAISNDNNKAHVQSIVLTMKIRAISIAEDACDLKPYDRIQHIIADIRTGEITVDSMTADKFQVQPRWFEPNDDTTSISCDWQHASDRTLNDMCGKIIDHYGMLDECNPDLRGVHQQVRM